MKARKRGRYTSTTEAGREVSREVVNKKEEIFREAVDDIYVQLIASVFWTMNTRFGWGKKRLGYLLEALKDNSEHKWRKASSAAVDIVKCRQTNGEIPRIDFNTQGGKVTLDNNKRHTEQI